MRKMPVIAFLEKLVNGGYARWKPDWDKEKLKQAIQTWHAAINANRLRNILGEEQARKSIA